MPSITKRAVLRWTLRIAGGLVALIVLVVAAVYTISEFRFRKRYEVPSHTIVATADSVTAARGEHIVKSRGCMACHGKNLVGKVEMEDPMFGRLAGPNLTNGGRGAELSDADWERAVRHGVKRDGTPLFIMPAFEHTGLSDEDIGAIAAYARSLPASTNAPPKSYAGPIIRALFIAGAVPVVSAEMVDHKKSHPAHVDVEPTAKYGAYLGAMCAGCHGPTMSGGKIPGGPPEWKPAANLTPTGMGHYNEETFIRAMRTGVRPDGSKIDEQMPWKDIGQMDDTELRALYAYLRTLTPRMYGNR